MAYKMVEQKVNLKNEIKEIFEKYKELDGGFSVDALMNHLKREGVRAEEGTDLKRPLAESLNELMDEGYLRVIFYAEDYEGDVKLKCSLDLKKPQV